MRGGSFGSLDQEKGQTSTLEHRGLNTDTTADCRSMNRRCEKSWNIEAAQLSELAEPLAQSLRPTGAGMIRVRRHLGKRPFP